jgi:hypothetical protein
LGSFPFSIWSADFSPPFSFWIIPCSQDRIQTRSRSVSE